VFKEHLCGGAGACRPATLTFAGRLRPFILAHAI
jgi:hypothetical protein